MLLPKTRWVLKNSNEEKAQQLAKALNIDLLLAKLLVNRGIETVSEAMEFIHVEEKEFHDPFLLPDMEKAVERIQRAIQKQEKILIFGDYDADGVTATTLLMEALQNLGANVTYYIPDRFTEGYGPNEAAFREAKNEGIELIITVDTGIAAINEAKLAKELNMDLIITDHHELAPELPDAYAIIHPKVPNSTYPFKELAGVGVAFKLAHALYGEITNEFLELATIGTIADLVPLINENRLIVKRGLRKLANTKRIGLQQLCNFAGMRIAEVNEESVGFIIGPRLNAAGRLDKARIAVELLLTKDEEEAKYLAEQVDDLNRERQEMVSDMTEEAVQMVENHFPIEENAVLVLGKEGWNAGVIGIVASRLVEKYYRPTIILSYDRDTGLAKGSARSIPGFDIFEHLSSSRDILPHFGGHSMAAGMTLQIDDVDRLRERLNNEAKKLDPKIFIPTTELDASITLDQISVDSISKLDLLAPYGMNNPKPIILVEKVFTQDVRKIGANQNHLKVSLIKDDYELDGVGFYLGDLADDISPAAKISIIGELSINEWNNRKKPQIFIKDMEITEWQLFDLRGNRQIKQWLPSLIERNCIFIFFSKSNFDKIGRYVDGTYISSKEEAEAYPMDGKNIVLFDLPKELEMLDTLVKGKAPARIYTYFYHKEEHFFSTIPTREHFKWYYAFLLKQKTFDLEKYGTQLASRRGWSKDTIQFMSQVFLELDFVTINNGKVTLIPQKQKKDLQDAPTYKKKKLQIQLEQELLYSSFQELKEWFDHRLRHDVDNKEEIVLWI